MQKKHTSKESGNALLWFILIVVGIWVIWYFTGGPQRAALQEGQPFMNPSQPVDNGNAYSLQN
jgi:hypothetical protein